MQDLKSNITIERMILSSKEKLTYNTVYTVSMYSIIFNFIYLINKFN